MIRKANEMNKDVMHQMRGGEGNVEITHMFKKEELKGKARLCAKIKVNPGSSIGLHEHVDEEEIFYIIRGKGIFDDNGVETDLSVGDAIITGDGAAHSVKNNGQEPLEMVAVILT